MGGFFWRPQSCYRSAMTESRRAELDRRLAGMRARKRDQARQDWDESLRQALAPILDPLEMAGEPHALVPMSQVRDWIPGWVPWGWSEMPWHLAPVARGLRWWPLDTPEPDIALRDATAAEWLDALADNETPVLIVYEDYWTALRVSKAVALRHLPAALAAMPEYRDVWILSPPHDWIIRLDMTGVIEAYEGKPPSASDLATAHAARRAGRRELLPDLRRIATAGIRYRLDYPEDPAYARWPGPGPFRPRWDQLTETLRFDMRADPEARDMAAYDFVAARPGDTLRMQLHYQSTSACRVPDILIRRQAFLDRPGMVIDSFRRPFLIRGEGAEWLLEIGPVMMRGAG
ncbi:hypothetical protein P1X14_14630 [Sphingomonas sp. AOB5]|uniref:hypothetical protein n=1 Tax=Sphingomonas sp. AOB5 TaxID=3034017 RepID=UPI0023F9FF79|nr:hypothetical protein [Sphingomonas sp. AOB5]MDF7776488.1 hypothetical protein [Sphingomonas sp. AOB5]